MGINHNCFWLQVTGMCLWQLNQIDFFSSVIENLGQSVRAGTATQGIGFSVLLHSHPLHVALMSVLIRRLCNLRCHIYAER